MTLAPQLQGFRVAVVAADRRLYCLEQCTQLSPGTLAHRPGKGEGERAHAPAVGMRAASGEKGTGGNQLRPLG